MRAIRSPYYRVSIKWLITNNENKFLLAKDLDGNWCLPWGWLDWGEDIQTCITREIKEEMWLEVISFNQIPKVFAVARKVKCDLDDLWLANVLYEIKVKDLNFVASNECQEIWFFNFDEAKNIEMYANVRAVLDELEKIT